MRDRRDIETNMAESMENSDIDQDSDSTNMEVEQTDNDASAEEIERLLREADITDIPLTIIVTNVHVCVFDNDNSKVSMCCCYSNNRDAVLYPSFSKM